MSQQSTLPDEYMFLISSYMFSRYRGRLKSKKKYHTKNYQEIITFEDDKKLLIDIFTHIRTVMEKGDFKSQKEAAWAVTNTTTSGTPEQIIDLIEKYQVLKPYCDLLEAKDARTIKVVLTGLSNLFALAEKLGGTENLCLMVEQMGGLDKLENLQTHENEEVYKKAYAIVDSYFSNGNDNESELAPKEVNGALDFNSSSQPNAPEGGFNF